MIVLPATHNVDLDKLQVLTGAATVTVADEHEYADRFPDCEIGAMPPFGNLYGMPVLAAEVLLEDQQIVFNAGSHTESVKMELNEFVRLVKPTFRKLSRPREPAAAM
jgi:Ala-tRNA(Pro) deacylase